MSQYDSCSCGDGVGDEVIDHHLDFASHLWWTFAGRCLSPLSYLGAFPEGKFHWGEVSELGRFRMGVVEGEDVFPKCHDIVEGVLG